MILMFAILISIYALFSFYFYKFVAKRKIIDLNLNQYNTQKAGFLYTLFVGIFFIVEYLILMPIFIFFWFACFSILLLVVSKNTSITTILLISGSLIGSIRICSYFNEDLSRDIAKIVPLTILTFFLIGENFFNFEIILNRFSQIPGFFPIIAPYIIFILLLEVILLVVSSFFEACKN